MRGLLLTIALLMPVAGQLAAQKVCKKGKPCGNSCIAQSYTCHVGEPAETSPQPEAQPLTTAAPAWDGDWVASLADSVYFKASCDAAQDLRPLNKRYFPTEAKAKAAGFRRSRVKGC